MTLRKRLSFIVVLFISLQINAEPLKIKSDRPDNYTVKRGDTLWSISGKFLQQPRLWPKVWHKNPQVKNPHLIFPGDILSFEIVNGKPSIRHTRGREVKLYPSIRTSVLESAIKMIPPDAIAQFLSSPKVLETNELQTSPYVIDFPDDHVVAGAGDRIYVRQILNPQTLNYTVYRQGKPYLSPETGAILGYEALYIGDALLNKAGDPATLRLIKSDSEIRVGDRLMPSNEDEFSLNFFPEPPSSRIYGSILNVLNGVSQIGHLDIVVIDKGLRENLKQGHILNIYQRGRVIKDPFKNNEEIQLPEEIAGTLMIFRVFKRVSYALVMKSTAPIHILDKVRTP